MRCGVARAMAAAGIALCALAARPAASASGPATPGLFIGSEAAVFLGAGQVALACGDVEVTGKLLGDAGILTGVGNFVVQPGASVYGGTSAIDLAGSFSQQGEFAAENGSVQLTDGCGITSAAIFGSSTFASLSLSTAAGKTWAFEAGSTQTVTQSLDMSGAPTGKLLVRSTVDGVAANLALLPGASQSTADLDVKDDHAVGEPILFGNGSVDSGNTDGWVWSIVNVPAAPAAGVALLAFSLASMGAAAVRRRGARTPAAR